MSTNQNENIKYALCYIPIVAIIILFIEDKKEENLKKHIRYGIIMFLIYLILTTIITLFFFSWAFVLNGLIVLIYFILSGILGYKAYSGEEGQVDILDDIENKIKDTFK